MWARVPGDTEGGFKSAHPAIRNRSKKQLDISLVAAVQGVD
jgi:hypothetical protein